MQRVIKAARRVPHCLVPVRKCQYVLVLYCPRYILLVPSVILIAHITSYPWNVFPAVFTKFWTIHKSLVF